VELETARRRRASQLRVGITRGVGSAQRLRSLQAANREAEAALKANVDQDKIDFERAKAHGTVLQWLG
jgi:hypothetical protein